MPTYEYFYTVSAYTDYKKYLLDTGGTATQSLYASLYEDPSFLNGEWSHKETRETPSGNVVYTGPATESAPYATTIKVKKDFAITYLVKFYLKVTDSPTFNGIYFLNDDCITDVKFTPVNAENTKQLSTATHNSGNTFFQPSSYPGLVAGTASAGTGYSTIYSIIKKSFKMGPAFTVTANVTPQNYQTPSGATPHPSATQVTITNAMISGMKPGINCTDAVVQNNPPDSLTSSLAARGATFPATSDYYNFTYSYAYDTCTKDKKKVWTGVKWFVYKATSGTYKGKTVIRYQRIFADKDGNLTYSKPVEVSAAKNGTTDITGTNGFYMNPSLEKILEGIVSAKLGNCGAEVDDPSGGTTPDEESAILTRPEQPTDALRWNPPPHVDARGVDYVTRAGINKSAFFSSDGSQLDPSAFRNIVNTYLGTRPERGRIFQDQVTAKVMNLDPGLSLNKKTGKALQWGFRFMYNPEMITYENSDNSGVDWTYGSKDKSILLAGSQTFSFDLLLNRIPDMSYLQTMRNSPQTWNELSLSQPSIQSQYGRFLQTYEIDGILKRGTEYDIEFLYRVLTGDPMPNSLLLEKGSTQLTADIGYTTKVPVWLFLNENMRLFGSVSSISVTHRIFDQNMVPMLTRLSIGFTRYPAYEGKSPNTGKEYKTDTKTKSTTGTTGG